MGVVIKVGILTAPKIEFEQREHTFLLKNVRIGIGFHWDRYEDQEFAGELEIRNNPDGTQTAINTLELEDYLCSVISSEMNANSPMELLKAHAVISRSWAMRAIEKPNHEGFHVCADDHCQRYEGLRRMNERAVQAVRETTGQVLLYGDEVCDCRYYKCCGGRTEIWRTCWEDIDLPYIQSVECPYCGRVSAKTLRLVLNDYDQETKDFHDWKVTYTAEELSEIIREKSGIDFGDIIDLIPLHRGASGRIDKLRIVGTKHTEEIGKELKIRLWLSRTCLYSSWFEVIRSVSPKDGLSVKRSVSETVCQSEGRSFTLIGHGWGHGAGLCQIGAAQMAEEGFTHEQILAHYYVGTRIGAATR
ncbi:MAG: SpoIID/LytB domain-containing protein [Paludibacteraceae bacterium]|nr:SpoIID/LytB domain-containing protein [Paludibacteraceae bacterium]